MLDIHETQNTTVNFPILADADRSVATLYNVIHPNALATGSLSGQSACQTACAWYRMTGSLHSGGRGLIA